MSPAFPKPVRARAWFLALALLLAQAILPAAVSAALFGVPSATANPNGWFLLDGTASADADGDAIHTMTFKIEVTGTQLNVLVFDPGNDGARDLVRSGGTSTTFTLRDPSGAVMTSVAQTTDNGLTDNKFVRLDAGAFKNPNSAAPFTVEPGLYELEIAMGGGTDINAFGLQIDGVTVDYNVYTSTDAPGGNEDGQLVIGALNSGGNPVANVTQPATFYPYVDRGCFLVTTNYDDDTGGGNAGAGSSATIDSRLGTSTALTMSGNSVGADDTVTYTQATQAQDYGIWRLDWNTGTQQNLADWRVADDTGLTVPGALLPHRPDAPLRLYLPDGTSTPGAPVAPLEPRVEQSLTPLSPGGSSSPGGPNPPVVGQTSIFEVNVRLTNPTASAMTGVTLTANVPGGQVLYESNAPPAVTGGAQVSGGGAVSAEPADGGSGDVVADWVAVNAGATVTLTYFIAVTPTGGSPVDVTATPASGDGTRLTYTPAFSSATFPRTETIGPLCQLSVQASTVVPNAVALGSLEANGYAGQIRLAWSTDAEWNNLGWNVYRAEGPAGRFMLLNRDLILGAGTSSLQARYLFIDPDVRDGVSYAYLLEDVDRNGTRTLHGPVRATAGGAPAPGVDPAATDSVSTIGGALGPGAFALAGAAPAQPAPASGAAAGGGSAPAAVPAPPPRAIAKIVSRDDAGIVLDLRIPQAALAPVTLDGAPYTDVSIRGFARAVQPGHPALPEIGIPVAIPDVADVTLEVASVHAKRIGGPVIPAPAPEITVQPDGTITNAYAPDPAVYGGDVAVPAEWVSLAGSVREGDRRLLVLRLDPVRWSPSSGELVQARRVRLRLAYEGARAAAAATSADARRENQFLIASRRALRIAVDRTGVQRVTGQALLDAGLPADVDPRRLSLYTGGREASILVEGEEDGRLDPADAIVFHGEALASDHALARTYWLLEGRLVGARMASRDGAPSGVDAGETTTPALARLEKNLVHVPFVLNGEISNFVGDSIFQNPRDQTLSLDGVTAEAATLRVRVQGATSDSNLDPDHHLALSVNGVPVGDARWDGFGAFEGSFAIPPGTLAEGANQVRFTPIADTGAAFDFDYVDWVEIEYARTLAGAGAALAFETAAAGDHALLDVDGGEALLLDVTDPLAPLRIEGVSAGSGVVRYRADAGTRRMRLVTGNGFATPASVTADTPSRLHDAPGTDWLAIAHASLVAGTQPLAALRVSEGMRARVVDVQDVYDEFGFGDPDPQAIKDFLAWQHEHGGLPRLRYALLVGDASYDERDFLHGPNPNLVPTKRLDGTFTERASDNWFASFLGEDALPDVALGRLPARDAAQLDTLVSKITAYAAAPSGEDWQARALLVADDGFRAFQPGEAARFEATADAMAGRLPPGFEAVTIFLSSFPEAQQQAFVRQAIVDTLNAGALLAAYIGHGGITLWADEVVFRASDLPLVSNAGRLPFVVVLNCLNGFFDAPSGDALGESMLSKADGGAVAFFAPTSVSPIAGQDVMGEAIARALFHEGHPRVGDALVRARESMLGLPYFEDLSNSWVLLGDPATRLAFRPIPVADAGEDRVIETHARVLLDGSGSGGVPGPLAWDWRITDAPAGARPSLRGADTASPELRVDGPGDYRLRLVVRGDGRESVPDDVVVHVLSGKRGF